MELAGVLIAVLLLIFLIYKRLSLIPATLICVAVLALTNGFSYMDLFINHYGVSLAGFVGKYFWCCYKCFVWKSNGRNAVSICIFKNDRKTFWR